MLDRHFKRVVTSGSSLKSFLSNSIDSISNEAADSLFNFIKHNYSRQSIDKLLLSSITIRDFINGGISSALSNSIFNVIHFMGF